jgi:hypothetical protein
MLLFRSEDHVTRWLQGRRPGATLPVAKVVELAEAWYRDRLDPEWVPHTREQNQAILEAIGLTDPFWDLAGANRP